MLSEKKSVAKWKQSLVFVRACVRCGFASKMEGAWFLLETCSERSLLGGRSCTNLFHNDWNVPEPRPWKFMGRLNSWHATAEKLLQYLHIVKELPRCHLHILQSLVLKALPVSSSVSSAFFLKTKVQVNTICCNMSQGPNLLSCSCLDFHQFST